MAEAYKRYELGEAIASGGMGEILLARDVELNREVALKRMLIVPDESDGPEAVRYFERFLEEAQITAQLDHPAIVPIHSIGFDGDGRAFYTMRLVRGRELSAVFRLLQQGKEGWNVSRVIAVLIKVCQAVAYAHSKGIAHRDIKPSNIMVGDLGEVYVMDWGLAKAFECLRREALRSHQSELASGTETIEVARKAIEDPDRSATVTGNVVGTPAYLAPELASGALRTADPQGDVYALGAVLYHLLAEHPPYMAAGESTTAQDVIQALQRGAPTSLSREPNLAAELVAICDRAMARDLGERYQTCLELAEDLQAFLDGRVVRAYESGNVARLRKWVNRNRALAAATVLSLVALIGVAWVSTWSSVKLSKALSDTEAERQRTVEVLADSFFQRGVQHYRQAEVRSALASWAQALSYDADHDPAAARIAAACLQHKIPLAAAEALRTEERVVEFNVSDDGRFVATNDGISRVRVWDRERKEWLGSWEFEVAPRYLWFAPNDSLLMVLSIGASWRFGEVHWIDLKTGELKWPSHPIDRSVTGFDPSWSSDGRFVTACGILWSLEDGSVLMQPEPDPIRESNFEFGPRTALSSDGRLLAMASRYGVVFLYDVLNRAELARVKLKQFNARVSKVVWAADDDAIVVAFENGAIYVLPPGDLASGGGLSQRQAGSQIILPGSDGLLILIDESGRAELFDPLGRREVEPIIQSDVAITRAALRQDGQQLVTVGADYQLRVWNLQTKELACEPIPFCLNGAYIGNQLVSINLDGSIQEWRVSENVAAPVIQEFRLQNHHRYASLAKGGKLVLGPGARAYEVTSGKLRYDLENESFGPDAVMAVSPSQRKFAVANRDRPVSVRSVDSGELLWESPTAFTHVKALGFSATGRLLAVISEDGNGLVWDLTRPVHEVSRFSTGGHVGGSAILRFDASESAICLSDWGGGPFAWKTDTGDVLGEVPFGDYAVYARFREGLALEALIGRQRFSLWDVRLDGFRPEFELSHRQTIVGLDASVDGRWVATASHDGSAQVWDSESGMPVGDRLRHDKGVYAVRLDPSADRLATSSAGRSIDLWDHRAGVRLMKTQMLPAAPIWYLNFSDEGHQLFGAGPTRYTVWDLPPSSAEAIPDWWSGFAESLAGFKLRRSKDPDGVERIHQEPISAEDQLAFWNQIVRGKSGNRYSQIARWFLTPDEKRAGSPYRLLASDAD